MAEQWNIRSRVRNHDGEPCPIDLIWPLINAAGAWYGDPSPANTERLAAVVEALQTLGIMVPEGKGADDGE